MKKKIEITYWLGCEKFKKGIPKELAEALEEAAETRISEMMQSGYTSGQLISTVDIDVPGRRTPKAGYEFKGWFDVVKTDVK